ncbi:MAG: hypothetical protein KF830_15750 [Planctomycetes bacterium]|nr:hypothetical protein [Planctomycetota bacterium]
MRCLAAVVLVAAAHLTAQQQTFIARNGTFQLDLPASWRQLSPGEARTIAALPGAPADLGYVEPRLFYAIGPVDDWLQGRFDTPWLWVVEQDNEWVVDDDFAFGLRRLWQQRGEATGTRHELAEVRRDEAGPRRHPVLTARRTSTLPGGGATTSLDVHAPTGGRQVSLSFTCRAGDFDRWEPEFRNWLATVRFARAAQGEPQLSDRLWTPLATGAVVTVLLLLLYKHTRRRS